MANSVLKPSTIVDSRARVAIEAIEPQIDGGRFRVKRVVGDTVIVKAEVFTDGNDVVAAVLNYRFASDSDWSAVPMRPTVNDRWTGEFRVERIGIYQYQVAGWVDHFATWKRDLLKRIDVRQDATVDLLVGADLIG